MPRSHSYRFPTFRILSSFCDYPFARYECIAHRYHIIGKCNQLNIVIISNHLSSNQFHTIILSLLADKLLQRLQFKRTINMRQHPIDKEIPFVTKTNSTQNNNRTRMYMLQPNFIAFYCIFCHRANGERTQKFEIATQQKTNSSDT